MMEGGTQNEENSSKQERTAEYNILDSTNMLNEQM